jgi:PBSX family phage terminase large subunit|tara:strand:+ start:3180 stop:4292 length:1113 start_codon:yes stop_codon:yes gene_type:complete
MLAKGFSQNNQEISYIAPTYQQARDIAWTMLKREVRPIMVKANESRLAITIRTQEGGESTIDLRGWESIETMRGVRRDFLVVDEVAMMRNFWENWHEVLRPTLTDSKGDGLFISTPKGFNHFYDLYNTIDEDFSSFHFTTYDNPHIPKEEVDKAAEEIPEDRFAQEYMADFRKTEGLVYKEFQRKQHVVDKLPPAFNTVIGGVDFGYTNPWAGLVIGVDKDAAAWVICEEYATGKTNTEIVEKCKIFQNNYKINQWYPDPAEPDRIEEMKRAGLNCREVNKSVVPGIDHIRELLKTKRLKIHESCLNLINEFETYRYADKKPNHNEKEEPVKENDHALDGLRYALFTYSPAKPRRHGVYTFKTDNMGRII